MNFTLKNDEFSADGILGEMYSDDNSIERFETLQHAYDSSNGDGSFIPKIPPGTYSCKRRFSPHFKFDVFEVQNVPNCSFIEIHPGNNNSDSEGCILIGTTRVGNTIIHSRDAFVAFMAIQKDVNEFILNVI